MNSTSVFTHRYRLSKTLGKALHGIFTEYETPKLVLIHSLSLTILLRIMQIILLIYSGLYLLLYEKGYQKQDTSIISSVTLKVKGIGNVQMSPNETIVMDVADYIIPPSENNAIFIMSNFFQTDQMRSRCPESARLKEAKCVHDDDCTSKSQSGKANGRWTGRCILPTEIFASNETSNIEIKSTGLCEYAGWCPPENDEVHSKANLGILNFTIFIKNFIEFPIFHVKHKNLVDNLQACVFHPVKAQDCPIFTLDYIINQAESNATERDLMLRYGAVISIKLDWDCNLDRHVKLCKPEYTFARLDVPFSDKSFSHGFNFRYASHWKHEKKSYRTLTKAYGLRLIIAVSGKAGKFDSITLSLNTGSLVGIFGLATFFCDIILLHLSKQSPSYRKHVFEKVHCRTRFSSVLERSKNAMSNDELHKTSETNTQTDLSNEAPKTLTNSLRKTISLRPLTLVSSEEMAQSERI